MTRRILSGFWLLLFLAGMEQNCLWAQSVDTTRHEALVAAAKQWMRRRPPLALQYANQTFSLAQQDHDLEHLAKARLLQGEAEWHLAHYRTAYQRYEDAQRIYLSIDDERGVGEALCGLSQVAWRLGDYAQAYLSQEEALSTRQHARDTVGLIQSYYWLGILQADLGEYSQARQHYRDAYHLAMALPDSQMIANVLNYEARSWRKQEVYDTALVLHEKSLAIYEALHDSIGISDYHNNLGSIYRRMADYDRALDHFFMAIVIQEKLQDQEGLADGYNDIGKTYSQIGEYGLALKYLQRALEIARRTGLIDDMRYAYENLAFTYDLLGDYEKAFRHYRMFATVRDSINLEQQDMQNQLMRRTFEREKQQEEALRKARLRSLWALWVGIVVVILLIAGFQWWRMRWQRRINNELAEKNQAIAEETERSEALLHNILPISVAEELKTQGPDRAIARKFDSVSVMFADFAGFTHIAAGMTPEQLVEELHACFQAFDRITADHGLEKIKTIGDAYMCAGGLPEPNHTHASDAVRAALAMQDFLQQKYASAPGHQGFQARIGIHTGPVVAGVVGSRKFAYDIWGDTVNTASRMETAGKVGKVNVSADTFALIQTDFICHSRGKIKVKHKGDIEMYFVDWEI